MQPEVSVYFTRAKECIDSVRGKSQTTEERCDLAVELASWIACEANRIETNEEYRRQQLLARLVADPKEKAFLVALADQLYRSQDTLRAADQVHYLLQRYGVPSFLSLDQRLGLKLFQYLGKPLHRWMVPMMQALVRRETEAVIIEQGRVKQHLEKRREEGFRVNLNHLGEAILGEEEAAKRFQVYLDDLKNPAIDYISVKISTLYSQVNLLAREKTLQILGSRLKQLYREAPHKFVNLDMEEFRDLYMTVDLFQDVLQDPEFLKYKAGIALQSYLPESFIMQQELTRLAAKRVQAGGAPIKIRLVKGANLAMEKVEASLRGWPQAPYEQKIQVDAHFKRMLEYGCQREHLQAVHIGIGSHNLFDIAYALLLKSEELIGSEITFEVLEGMADAVARVVKSLTEETLVYCPVSEAEGFQYAIAYLVRRLDENTSSENFLSDSFSLKPGSAAWERQEYQFRASCERIEHVKSHPQRTQNRMREENIGKENLEFANEPDTDWALPQNREWAEMIVEEWKDKKANPVPQTIEIEPLLATAKKAEAQTVHRRSELLAQVAHLFRRYRGALIGAMIAETSKTIPEADTEVSEAIDFIEYYRRNAIEIQGLNEIRFSPKGIVLVASPWNFPCSIPVGGIAAALAAGNSVLFKPAPEAVSVGLQLAELFWQGGISREALQYVACDEETVGSALVKAVSTVILTGATATARHFQNLRSGLDLMAETGGKNSLIVTRLADRDLAVRDIIQSAFGYAGQKCSACSLLICEAEVYDDPAFRHTLKDAAASLIAGSPWDLATRVNPLIRPPGSALLRGFTTLDEGEEWLLEPIQDPQNPLLYTPGIKLGIKEGSFTHQTELFGPVLGVMRAENLEHAIRLANGTPYGLTAGIHTLDEREKKIWLESIQAGNCYINRTITGAIVLRQPFGGCKASSFGPGAKAGGPNYVMQLLHADQMEIPKEREKVGDNVRKLGRQWQGTPLWEASVGSYAFYWKHYFSRDHDLVKLLGQDNIFRYVPRHDLTLWVQEQDAPIDIDRAKAAALTCGADLKVIQASPEEIIQKLANGEIARLRCLSTPPPSVARAAAAITLIVGPVLATGRLELLHFLREVSISHDTHRYGNLTG